MSYSDERHELPPRKEAALRNHEAAIISWVEDAGEKVVGLLIRELGEQGANIAHAMLDSDELHEKAADYAEGGEGFLTGVSAGLKAYKKEGV